LVGVSRVPKLFVSDHDRPLPVGFLADCYEQDEPPQTRFQPNGH
jgi:hypothetical protein